MNLDALLESTTRHALEEVLRVSNGNKSAAARLLDIGRPRLDRLMKDLGIEDPEA